MLIHLGGFVVERFDEAVLNLMAQCPERGDDDGQRHPLSQERASKDQLRCLRFTRAGGHLNDGRLAFENIRLAQKVLCRPELLDERILLQRVEPFVAGQPGI